MSSSIEPARGHAHDAPSGRLDDEPHGLPDRVRDVQLVRSHPAVRRNADVDRLRLRVVRDAGGPLHDPVHADDDGRGSDRRQDVREVRVEGAARPRCLSHAPRLRSPRRGALGALAGLPGISPPRLRGRLLVRLDGEPDRRGRSARPDRRRDRDERGHANDRRRRRRTGCSEHLAATLVADGLPGEKGYTLSFAIMALALVAAVGAALAVPGRKPHRSHLVTLGEPQASVE